MPVSAVALFCEDIREEKSGVNTLIGILPDNVAPPASSGPSDGAPIAKLCIYLRINFSPSDKVLAGTAKLLDPERNAIELGEITQALIDQASETAKKQGSPLAGLLTRAHLSAFALRGYGRFTVEVVLGDETYVAGFVNFQQPPKST